VIRKIDVDRDNNISTNIVDELSEIDLTRDVLIVLKIYVQLDMEKLLNLTSFLELK
jgi:hypothetical protein